ncbi:hypothetical protein [Glutamicibacter sp. NPDC087344]|uniref:hypothetical protein n=1 Tax=Glutamicibacter sp. NPDC087344 TaxID=3363994 RepID=UPI0037F49D62
MGYDVNYNAVDYADSRAIVVAVYARLQEMAADLIRAAQHTARCEDELNVQCSIAGIGARGYNLAVLAEHLRVAYQHTTEAVIAARRLNERVSAAIENYESAEATAQKLMLSVTWLQTVADFFTETMNNESRPPTQQMESLLRLLMLINPWSILRPESSTEELVTETSTKLGEALGQADPEGRLELTRRQPPEQLQLDGSLDDYTKLHRLLYDGGSQEHSKFVIAQVEPRTYVVVIPGTQDGFGGPNPFDSMGIVDGFGRQSENYAEPIAEALEYSGAGPGDEVILTGYSQGGIHVTNLLNNTLLRKKFTLTRVLTLGSPIGGIPVPPEIKTLSLEDAKDMVPGTDGRPNRTSPRQMTVTFDGPREEIKNSLPQDGVFGPPHSLTNYEDHLRELQENPAPEVRKQLEMFLLPPGPLVFRRFTLQRKPAETKNKPRDEKPHGTKKRPEPLDHLIAPPH